MATTKGPTAFASLVVLVIGILLFVLITKGRFGLTSPPVTQVTSYPSGVVPDSVIEQATHVVDLANINPSISTSGGTERVANADNATVLNVPTNFTTLGNWAMSIAEVRLNQGGVREPHWHTNAAELMYCTQGSVNVTIFNGSPVVVQEAFTLTPNQIAFIPIGFLHDIENTSSGESRVITAWNNERVQTEGISGSVGSIWQNDKTSRVVDQTFHMQGTGFWEGANNNSNDDIGIGDKNTAGTGQTPRAINAEPNVPQAQPISRYKLDLNTVQASVNTPGGSDTEGNISRFPVLKGLAAFSIWINPGGIREPHWHPNASELHYVQSGTGVFQTKTPITQSVETATLSAGSFFFVPPAYLHYFENRSTTEKLHVLAFFTNEDPQDLGFSGGFSSYSNAVLGATFKKPANYFNNLNRFTLDDGIVGGSKS